MIGIFAFSQADYAAKNATKAWKAAFIFSIVAQTFVTQPELDVVGMIISQKPLFQLLNPPRSCFRITAILIWGENTAILGLLLDRLSNAFFLVLKGNTDINI